ncbi:hypothetical protein L1887_36293 [Cichorium endivia]|nr:hypothetical protein L1887_36293 [Cichorium endivia]
MEAFEKLEKADGCEARRVKRMERRIDPDASLDYVELQIFPTHNRYEACVSTSNIVEKVASGDLQKLLKHLPQVEDLLSKSSNSNFKILAPEDFNDNNCPLLAYLFQSTRFLRIVGSPDILPIGNENFQLEETRKFQVSLFSKKRREGEEVSVIDHYKIGHFSKKKNKMVNDKADEIW